MLFFINKEKAPIDPVDTVTSQEDLCLPETRFDVQSKLTMCKDKKVRHYCCRGTLFKKNITYHSHVLPTDFERCENLELRLCNKKGACDVTRLLVC